MTCPHCTNGEILDSRGYTVTTCDCLMGILQRALCVADTGGDPGAEVFGVLGKGDLGRLALC